MTGVQTCALPISSVTGKPGFYTIDTFGTFQAGSAGGFSVRRAKGTSTTPTAVQMGDILGYLAIRGYGATGFSSALASGLRVGATDNFTDTAQGTYLELLTVPAGTTTASPVVFVEHNGNVVLNSTTQSTGSVTGALVVKGGAGIGGNLNVAGNLTVNGGGTNVFTSNVDVQATLYGRGVYDNGNRVASFTGGAGNVSLSSGNITLSLTGPGVTTVGSATAIPVVTTDAYGRVTSLTSATVGTIATANVSLYDSVTAYTTNQTFYGIFSNISSTGNTTQGVSSNFTFNPSTGALGTTLLNTTGVITSSGNIVAASGTNSTSATTGAVTIAGNGGLGVTGNAFFGNSVTINSTQTAGQDFIVRGKNQSTTLWVRPSATYDQVLIGGNATVSTLASGAALQINSTDSILLPVGSTAQRPSGAGYTDVQGMLRYSTTTGAIEWYTGSSWQTASTAFTLITAEQIGRAHV